MYILKHSIGFYIVCVGSGYSCEIWRRGFCTRLEYKNTGYDSCLVDSWPVDSCPVDKQKHRQLLSGKKLVYVHKWEESMDLWTHYAVIKKGLIIYYIYGDFLSPSKFPLFHLTTGQKMFTEQLGNWPLDNYPTLTACRWSGLMYTLPYGVQGRS